ncbi:MAG: L-histidine N(alpha)-methyltransferase [Actinomycetota bacterium]|nr:L-histidine N(alpha)-methyltransferase [Actinomycetota bacterium]
MTSGTEHRVTVERLPDVYAPTLGEIVLDGLTRPFKELPPKLLYDARGSELFEQITELQEYPFSRAERSLLETHAPAIASEAQGCELVELGAGYATKTRLLLDAMRAAGELRRYVPLDVSEASLRAGGETLAREYPDLSIQAVVGDFEHDLGRLFRSTGGRVVAFFGGTIGNLPPGSRARFLRSVASVLGPNGRLVLGTGLVADARMLEAAYDDAQGITAEFNRNVLHVLNRELGADFDPGAFEHVAFYDREHQWIEMRLRAVERMTVTIPAINLTVELAPRDEIRTEISAKFSVAGIERELRAAGLEPLAIYRDDWFAVTVARPAASPR